MTKKFLTMAVIACAFMARPASAQLPTNSYITFGGQDWAWASPCHSGGPQDCGAPVVPNLYGFRYATAAEWLNHPAESDFLDPLGNFLSTGGQIRCAAAYFPSGHAHCDYYNTVGNVQVDDFVSSGPGNGSSIGYEETFLVRGDLVPEPASMALLGTGLVVLFGVSRRRKA